MGFAINFWWQLVGFGSVWLQKKFFGLQHDLSRSCSGQSQVLHELHSGSYGGPGAQPRGRCRKVRQIRKRFIDWLILVAIRILLDRFRIFLVGRDGHIANLAKSRKSRCWGVEKSEKYCEKKFLQKFFFVGWFWVEILRFPHSFWLWECWGRANIAHFMIFRNLRTPKS